MWGIFGVPQPWEARRTISKYCATPFGRVRISVERRRRGSPRVAFGMPTISYFYGIVIRMYYDDHAPPHLHALYGGSEVLLTLEAFEVLEGGLPRRALALVREWAQIHKDELRRAWERAKAHEPLGTIEPLD